MEGVLAGKRALVSGGSSGIGLATAQLFARQGAHVVAFAKEWTTHPDGIECLVADVTQGDEVVSAVAHAAGDEGLDIMVANAGTTVPDDILGGDAADWLRVLDINLVGVMRCFQAAAADMVARKRSGRLLATGSIAGVRAFPDAPSYGASKAGLVAVVRSTALALAAHGITVNLVAPGHISDTELHLSISQQNAERDQRTVEEVRSSWGAAVPLGRFGQPAEIASAFLYLASDAASYITGEVICVDGGLILAPPA